MNIDYDNFFSDLLSKDTATKHIQQGTAEWEKARLGRFTSSEIHKIMDCGKRQMTPDELAARPKKGKGSKTTQVPDPTQMSDKGLKYIRQKVWETLTEQPLPDSYAFPLVRGKQLEPVAVIAYEEKYGVTTTEAGFQPFGDHAGGSPDRLIGDDEGLEIKCPSSDEQIDYLMLTDHYDLKRMYPDKFWQCVSLMLFTGRKKWNLSTYDPRIKDERLQLTRVTIEWEKVEEDIDSIIKALEGAVKEKLKLIQMITV